eukprot:gb/GECG01009787.1/.p1 GENE.gb/GECG01009787.1/~~gb/GECG01009787.1/.p1  ORF type:complete len:145 (+),score=42.42 gb/GECG01009787.1/:1-435(+)
MSQSGEGQASGQSYEALAKQAMEQAGQSSGGSGGGGGASSGQGGQQQQQQEREEQRRILLRQVLDSEAKERLNRLSIVKPEKARQVEDQILAMAQKGQMSSKITDNQVTQMLEGISGKEEEKKTKVTFKRSTLFDSDDEIDDDF